MTHYRKLRMDREPTNLFAIMNLLKSEGDPNDLAMFEHFKKAIKEEGRSWWGPSVPDGNGGKELLTQEDLEKLILYGDVMHVNQETKDKLRLVTGRSGLMKTIAFFNFMRFVLAVIHLAQKTSETIRSRGYLNAIR